MANYSASLLNESLVITPPKPAGSGVVWCPIKNDTDSSDDSHRQFLETAQFVTGLLIYPSFCFPGLVGNILTVIVLSRRNMQTSTNAFLSALAVSDSIKLINDALYFFVTLFGHVNEPLGNQALGYLYPYAHFVFNMSVCVSSWLTVSVAVERYILVCMPTKARAVWSRRRAVLLCSVIYFVMTSLALPSAFRYRTIYCVDRNDSRTIVDVELTELWKNNSFVIAYTWAQNLIRSIIPLIILVVLNICIIYSLSHTKAKRRRNSRHRVTVMMIVVILAFLLCITPDAILSTVFGFGYYEASNLARAVREITDSLLLINAAINFLIYCAFNQVFRKSFAQLCRSTKPKRGSTRVGWVTEMDESTYRRLSEAQNSMSNNSPRLNTPSSLPTDTSEFFPTTPTLDHGYESLRVADGRMCNKGNDVTKVYDSHLEQQKEQFQKLLPNGGGYVDENDHILAIRQRQLLHLQSRRSNHDPRRASSHGLKKSNNSLKRGRNARCTSLHHRQNKPPELVTYIRPDSPLATNRPGSNPVTVNGKARGLNVGEIENSEIPIAATSPNLHLQEEGKNSLAPNANQNSVLWPEEAYKILVFKEPLEMSAANENVSRNNESSGTYKDCSQEEKSVEEKLHHSINMINNDLRFPNPSQPSKAAPLKESNISGHGSANKSGSEKRKVGLSVSFSEDSTL